MNENAVGGLALAAVACHRVTIVQMRHLPHIELDLPPRVQLQFQIAAVVDLFDCSQLAVGEFLLVRRSRRL